MNEDTSLVYYISIQTKKFLSFPYFLEIPNSLEIFNLFGTISIS